jgi:hypothetical protein
LDGFSTQEFTRRFGTDIFELFDKQLKSFCQGIG